jgi:hypothetical protein
MERRTSEDTAAKVISLSLRQGANPASRGEASRLRPTSLDYVLVRDGLMNVKDVAREYNLTEGDCIADMHRAYEGTGSQAA